MPVCNSRGTFWADACCPPMPGRGRVVPWVGPDMYGNGVVYQNGLPRGFSRGPSFIMQPGTDPLLMEGGADAPVVPSILKTPPKKVGGIKKTESKDSATETTTKTVNDTVTTRGTNVTNETMSDKMASGAQVRQLASKSAIFPYGSTVRHPTFADVPMEPQKSMYAPRMPHDGAMMPYGPPSYYYPPLQGGAFYDDYYNPYYDNNSGCNVDRAENSVSDIFSCCSPVDGEPRGLRRFESSIEGENGKEGENSESTALLEKIEKKIEDFEKSSHDLISQVTQEFKSETKEKSEKNGEVVKKSVEFENFVAPKILVKEDGDPTSIYFPPRCMVIEYQEPKAKREPDFHTILSNNDLSNNFESYVSNSGSLGRSLSTMSRGRSFMSSHTEGTNLGDPMRALSRQYTQSSMMDPEIRKNATATHAVATHAFLLPALKFRSRKRDKTEDDPFNPHPIQNTAHIAHGVITLEALRDQTIQAIKAKGDSENCKEDALRLKDDAIQDRREARAALEKAEAQMKEMEVKMVYMEEKTRNLEESREERERLERSLLNVHKRVGTAVACFNSIQDDVKTELKQSSKLTAKLDSFCHQLVKSVTADETGPEYEIPVLEEQKAPKKTKGKKPVAKKAAPKKKKVVKKKTAK